MTGSKINQPGRDPSIDIARGLAMLLVLYGHALDIFMPASSGAASYIFLQYKYIYSFHMPAFFLISGMVFKNKGVRHALVESATLLFTAYIIHVVAWCLTTFIKKPNPATELIVPFFTLEIFYTLIVWFLAALALVRLAYFFFDEGGRFQRIAVIALALGSFAWAMYSNSNILRLSALLPSLMFYAFGHWLSRNAWIKNPSNMNWIFLGLVIAAVGMLAWLNQGCMLHPTEQCALAGQNFFVSMMGGFYGFLPLFVLTALLGSLMLVWAGVLIGRGNSVFARLLSWVGRHTIELVFINGIYIWFVEPKIRDHLWMAPWMPPLAIVTLLIVLQCLIARCCTKIASIPEKLARKIAVSLLNSAAR